MGIIVGSLAGQNWHRQVRRLGLGQKERFDYVFDKTAQAAKEFGFSPMGIDFGAASLPSTERSYLDELKARLKENNLVPMCGFGGVSCSYDAEVRAASLKQAMKGLEVAKYLGAKVSNFGTQRNGRVTRTAQLLLAVEQLKVIGAEAKRLGLVICQEDFDYWSSEELIAMSAGTGLDNVGINNDVGNWLIINEDPTLASKKVLPYTFHSHIRDYVLEGGCYDGVAVGDGLVDFEAALPIVAKAAANVDPFIFSIEVDTDDREEDECFRRSCEYVKGWLVRNGFLKA